MNPNNHSLLDSITNNVVFGSPPMNINSTSATPIPYDTLSGAILNANNEVTYIPKNDVNTKNIFTWQNKYDSTPHTYNAVGIGGKNCSETAAEALNAG